MTDPALLVREGGVQTGQCRSTRRDDISYIPYLRESVMRRLVEVLPASFGYERAGKCTFNNEPDDPDRPVSLTMTLKPPSAMVGLDEARAVNARLHEAGVTTLTLRIDEEGFYTFTATYDDNGTSPHQKLVSDTVQEHVVLVFGGDFAVDRLTPTANRRANEGANAIRHYNGLVPQRDHEDDAVVESAPRGALSFYQLNILIEGVCNQSLLPAVFFEHYERAYDWLLEHRRSTSIITYLNDLIGEITVEADATSPNGQTATLHRFLVISRGSLLWMRRGVESVRRSLLDQMMAVSHRQARLIQLNLVGVEYERTPEMTGSATESQMRGYVMLIATKLPLLSIIADGAVEAVARLKEQLRLATQSADAWPDGLGTRVVDLDALITSWLKVLKGLRTNVRSLETAVEHDWQERLLYEQEQTRSEQEAMAEIERSRRGRPEGRRLRDTTYSGFMIILTAVAVFVAARTSDKTTSTALGWRLLRDLWPVGLAAAVVFLTALAITGMRQLRHQRKPNNETYSFEFAYRLDERTDPVRVHRYLAQSQPQPLTPTMTVRRLGGWRIERISPDTTLIKVHSVAVVRVARLRSARFEIVIEIMIRNVSQNPQYFLRQCRMFGDSPTPLPPERIGTLVKEILYYTCAPLTEDFRVEEITGVTDSIYTGVTH